MAAISKHAGSCASFVQTWHGTEWNSETHAQVIGMYGITAHLGLMKCTEQFYSIHERQLGADSPNSCGGIGWKSSILEKLQRKSWPALHVHGSCGASANHCFRPWAKLFSTVACMLRHIAMQVAQQAVLVQMQHTTNMLLLSLEPDQVSRRGYVGSLCRLPCC